METRPRSAARILAPFALVAFGIAVIVIVASAGGSDSPSATTATKQEQRDLGVKQRRAAAKRAARGGQLPQGVYVVKTGDTLGSIAQKTGVPVAKLEELNPNLDPQALVSGQRLKLR